MLLSTSYYLRVILDYGSTCLGVVYDIAKRILPKLSRYWRARASSNKYYELWI